MMTEDQFSGLPKYAQEEITYSSNKIKELEGKFAQFVGDEDTAITIDSYPVAQGTVRFQLKDGHTADVRLDDGGMLDVNFSHAVNIIPMATNRIRLEPTLWR